MRLFCLSERGGGEPGAWSGFNGCGRGIPYWPVSGPSWRGGTVALIYDHDTSTWNFLGRLISLVCFLCVSCASGRDKLAKGRSHGANVFGSREPRSRPEREIRHGIQRQMISGRDRKEKLPEYPIAALLFETGRKSEILFVLIDFERSRR